MFPASGLENDSNIVHNLYNICHYETAEHDLRKENTSAHVSKTRPIVLRFARELQIKELKKRPRFNKEL
jgi:hypothetical protein